jgi:hypothetical protein
MVKVVWNSYKSLLKMIGNRFTKREKKNRRLVSSIARKERMMVCFTVFLSLYFPLNCFKQFCLSMTFIYTIWYGSYCRRVLNLLFYLLELLLTKSWYYFHPIILNQWTVGCDDRTLLKIYLTLKLCNGKNTFSRMILPFDHASPHCCCCLSRS